MSATGIVKIVGDHDRWQSNLVDNFERALDTKLQRANAKLLANLMQRLKSDAGRLARSPGNVAAMRWLGPAFERQLSKEGYGTLVTAFVGQFPGQFRFFDETLALLKLPKIDWAARDRKAFEAQQLTSIEALQSVVKTVGENAKKRALMSVGGLKIDDLANLLQEELGKTLPQAVGLADTAMSVFYATLADAGFKRYEDAGVEVRFRYYGPDDRITRKFCRHLIESGKAYTRDEIGRMDNGQIPNVMVSRGGYRCRHQWILAIDALDMSPPPDPEAKDESVPAKRAEPKPVAADGDKRTGPQVREQIKAKAAELAGAKPHQRAEAIRELLYAAEPAAITMDMKPGKGPREDFRLKRWNEGLDEFRRLVGSGTADGLTAKFVKTRKQRVFYSPDLKAVSIQADTPVATIIHELGHWLEHHVPAVSRLAKEFLARRTAGESKQSLRSLTKNPGYGSKEFAKPDRFLNPYIGKLYPGGYTEIMSMGLELLWADPERLATDPDYFDFVWSVIRG